MNEPLPTYAPMEEYGLGECYDNACPSCHPEAFKAKQLARIAQEDEVLAQIARDKDNRARRNMPMDKIASRNPLTK